MPILIVTAPLWNHVRSTSTARRIGSMTCSVASVALAFDEPAASAETAAVAGLISKFAGRAIHCPAQAMERMKVRRSAPTPISEPLPGRRLPKKRMSQNEMKVVAGMSHAHERSIVSPSSDRLQ